MKTLRLLSQKFLLIVFCLIACRSVNFAQVTATDLYLQTSEVNNIMTQYYADKGILTRFYFVEHSPERRERLKKLILDYQNQLTKLNFNQLNIGAKVDYTLFKRNLSEELYQFTIEEKEYEAIKKWFPFADSLYAVEKIRRRGTPLDAPKWAFQFNEMAKQITSLNSKLSKDSSITENLGKRGANLSRSLQKAIKSVYGFYNGYDPLFTWWMPQPYNRLDSLLKIYANNFQGKGKNLSTQKPDASGIVGNPIGKEEITRRLQLEMIPYTPEELVDIANKEFAWCDAEMLKASKELGFGDNWKAALEYVKTKYVEPSKQPQEMMRLYNESLDFLKKNQLITIPALAEEGWRMNMMSPERQLVNPFFLGGEEFIISYPTNTMTEDQKLMSMRGNNPHFSRATVHHELIAGHSLQYFMLNRNKIYRQFDTPFWMEGWALYWELLLYDMKFPQSPEDKIGMLFWRMHRCARIIFSLNYHTKNWTPQQCIDFLIDRVGHEKANAEGEVRRSFVGGYDPLYQIAYMIGGLQFRALKNELVDTGKMSYKQFHDGVMQENSLPIEMIRAILTKQSLEKDFKTNWRFYKFK